VLIVMDGFRPDYLSLAPLRHLRALMSQGMYYDTAWVGDLESTTPASHATIATGVYPRKHNVIGFGWRDPATGRFTYAPTNTNQIHAGYLEQTMTADGVPTVSDEVHLHNPRDRVVSVSGEKYYAAATMGAGADYQLYGWLIKGKFRPQVIGPDTPPARTHFKTVTASNSYFDLQDGFAADLAVRLVDTIRPRALLLNLPATDEAGHYYGTHDASDMRRIVKGTDGAIGKVVADYKRLGIFKQTLFVVTADHGMVNNSHIVPIHSMYSAFRAVAGTAQLDQEYRETMGSIWLTDPSQGQAVATAMAQHHYLGVEGALYKVQTGGTYEFKPVPSTAASLSKPLLRAYIDLANTEAGPAGSDVLLPYREDTLGFTTKNRKAWGKHGGFSWFSQHVPLMLEGPGVKRGISHFPAELVDIAPTIERLMGWQLPAGVDGVVLSDAENQPSAAEVSGQQTLRTRRLQDLETIRAHSQAQAGPRH
jgi:arylsulfatase A-like enzyme